MDEETKYVESELYGGRVKIRFYPLSHQYWGSIDGGKFTRKAGATTFIGIKDKSTPLGIWQQQMTLDFLLNAIAKGIPLDEDKCIEAVIQNDIAKDEAADIGKEMHDWLERYAKFKLKDKSQSEFPEMPNGKEATNGVNAFLEWESQHTVKYHHAERVVYSIKNDYMGTLDLDATVDKLRCLVDYKSSNGLYNNVRMQTAAYAEADEEEGHVPYQGRWALRFSKYTEKEYIKREKRKNIMKAHIARIKSIEYKEYPIKPYQVFEAKFLDKAEDMREDDISAFLAAKILYRWDAKTDWFKNKDY